ncbi:MAG: restriction endonuclease, partial [Bacteroidales bacterium]|nr:restriction endonuclease [Bacteroidales bacterium]
MKDIYADLHDINIYPQYTKTSVKYIAEIRHKGLKSYRVITDSSQHILASKIEAQFEIWDDRREKIVQKTKKEKEKNASLALAVEKTNEVKILLKDIENLLLNTLNVDNAIDWDSLIDKSKFSVPNPKLKIEEQLKDLEHSFSLKKIPKEPLKKYFEPDFSLFDLLFKSLKQKKVKKAEEAWQKELEDWESRMEDYQKEKLDFENKKDELLKDSVQLEIQWEQQKLDFYKRQEEANNKVEEFKHRYQNLDPDAIQEYCELVLNRSIYPDSFPKDFDLEYNPETKVLLVEYLLPSPDCLPRLSEVKFIATRKEFKEVNMSEAQFSKLYDTTIYKIVLRTIHELYESDQVNSLDAIIFNGWVSAINKATGKMLNSCIVSIEVKKSEFLEIDVAYIDPKTCFKKLKGISSSKLIGITAIQPVAQMNRYDKRFISSQDVIEKLNEGSNIAAMDWQEFEHLIREIFEKELQSHDGEVKVT